MDKKIRVLGVVLAGGRSQRFGHDKAEILVDGIPMLDKVLADLRVQVDDVAISGRQWRDVAQVEDMPGKGIGPLGGLCGALNYALERDFQAIVTVPVDVLPIPQNLVVLLGGERATVFQNQHLIGYWPVSLARSLTTYLLSCESRAFHRWLAEAEVQRVCEPHTLFNVNTPDDLALFFATRMS